ncbi:MAG TPA: hypothetical protein C5S51_02530 [Methanosarcinaceae archaeon]|nr:hypothetical protein [Methanosarcinaceae archaeon]
MDYNVRQIEDGKGNDLVLTGLRKIGKTLILKEFMHRLIKLNGRCVPVYIDLEGMGLEPKNFAFIYMGQVLHWFNSRGANMPIRIGERDQIYSELATLDDGKIIMRL